VFEKGLPRQRALAFHIDWRPMKDRRDSWIVEQPPKLPMLIEGARGNRRNTWFSCTIGGKYALHLTIRFSVEVNA
jgi:hypothetical protein